MDKYGEAQRRTVASLVSGLAKTPENIYEIGTTENAISYKDCVRNAIAVPYLRIAVKVETENSGRTITAEGTSSWLRTTNSGFESWQG